MTNYVLDHAKDKDLLIIYESEKGISERRVHVVAVGERAIRTYANGQWRTFLRARILSAVPLQLWDAPGPSGARESDRQTRHM